MTRGMADTSLFEIYIAAYLRAFDAEARAVFDRHEVMVGFNESRGQPIFTVVAKANKAEQRFVREFNYAAFEVEGDDVQPAGSRRLAERDAHAAVILLEGNPVGELIDPAAEAETLKRAFLNESAEPTDPLERIATAADALTKFIIAVVDIGSQAIVADTRPGQQRDDALELVNPAREMFDLEPLA